MREMRTEEQNELVHKITFEFTEWLRDAVLRTGPLLPMGCALMALAHFMEEEPHAGVVVKIRELASSLVSDHFNPDTPTTLEESIAHLNIIDEIEKLK